MALAGIGKYGMVTVFAFDESIGLGDGGGWWSSMHWQVLRYKHAGPLLLVAETKAALAVASADLGRDPSASSG